MKDNNFNSRPCVRGDSKEWQRLAIQIDFNSRPCVRGDLPPDITIVSR